MNTAVIAAGTASGRPIRHSTFAERFIRRAGLALAWGGPEGRRHSREDLTLLHERRLEAARLREENFRSVTFARLF